MPDAWSVAQVQRALATHPLAGPVLDVGTGEFSDWFRPLVTAAGLAYTALDQTAYEGVDLVREARGDNLPDRYGTVLLLSVLEHTCEPQEIVDWTVRQIQPGGHLLVAVPYCWDYHGFPGDYWRILPDGLRHLVGDLKEIELVTETHRLSERGQLFAVFQVPA